jgi:hypothetical protein
VIIERIDEVPKEFSVLEKVKDDCLAHGEVTGHSHKLFRFGEEHGAAPFDLRIAPNGLKLLVVKEPVELRHQEHNPRIIPPGNYVIKIQREYDPFTKLARQVAD